MKIKLQILKSDIETTKYIDADDCAITRALRRAGFSHLKDVGFGIRNKHTGEKYHYSKDLSLMLENVIHMYTKEKPKRDFECEIELPDEFVNS